MASWMADSSASSRSCIYKRAGAMAASFQLGVSRTTMLLSIIVLAVLPVLAVYLYQKLHYHRFVQYASWPQMQPSLLWGHLKKMNEFIERGVRQRHVGALEQPASAREKT
jgi:leucyl-tRNA synthetase